MPSPVHTPDVVVQRKANEPPSVSSIPDAATDAATDAAEIGPPGPLGYRFPAEWEPHRATWISWPHNRDTWPGNFEPVEPVMVEAVRALASSEPVYINVLSPEHERHVRGLLGGIDGEIRTFLHPTNDAWCRDHGATFVVNPGALHPLAAVDWEYNAWGGKYPPYDLDQRIAGLMAAAVGAPRHRPGFHLEGGAIETNGAGVLLTTASCVLNPNRNPGWVVATAERRLKECLGLDTVIWVEGDILGDDTDGHIDNLARFVTPTDVLMVVSDAEDHPALRPAFERLKRDAAPLGIRVHPLPLPEPVYFEEHRLPASYANFYIGNRVILLPVYGCAADDVAARTIGAFFPDRTVVPIDCTELAWGLGAFHCLTQQVPAVG